MSHGIRTWKSSGAIQTDSSSMQGGMLLLGTFSPATGLNQSTAMSYASWAGRQVRAMLFSQYRRYYTVAVTYPGGTPTVTVTSTRAGNQPAFVYVFGK